MAENIRESLEPQVFLDTSLLRLYNPVAFPGGSAHTNS